VRGERREGGREGGFHDASVPYYGLEVLCRKICICRHTQLYILMPLGSSQHIATTTTHCPEVTERCSWCALLAPRSWPVHFSAQQ
jgi:hypothetical protein